MIELHDVSIHPLIHHVSATIADGQAATITGAAGAGKTTLLRALLGFIPVDEGHISIDGELLTPQSAPYFRRFTAYVPQRLSVPDGYDRVPTDYLLLLERAVESGKPLLLVDEPAEALTDAQQTIARQLLDTARQRGMTVVAVGNVQSTTNQIEL